MTPDDALRIAAAFGVHGTGARELPGGYTNDTWLVHAPTPVVVRRFGRLHLTHAAIRFELALRSAAAARLEEVVAPLHDALGAPLRDDGGAYVAVFPYIDGTTGARDAGAAEDAAELLARYHRAVHGVHLGGPARATRFLGILPWLRERFLRLAADRLVARKVDWDALIVAVSAAATHVAPAIPELPHVLVHGDPNPGNIVRRDGRCVGLIDFDFAHESERIYDVGVLCDEFGRDADDAPLDVPRVGRIVAAYARNAPLAAAERAVLPEAMVRRAATLAWYVATRHGQRVPGDVGAAPRYAKRAREIGARAEEIREAAR